MTTLGRTGLKVSRLGVGLAEIGRLSLDEIDEAGQVLNTALDSGINLLDTAACYGNSEELVGRVVAHRRHEYVLTTKCGHVIGGYVGQAWTAKTVRDSIDLSLTRLKTDYLDVVQLHSCSLDVLEQGEVVQELLTAKEAGKTRFVGYSGDNKEAHWAVGSDLFDTLQTSFNLVDQHARTKLLPLITNRNVGLIVKRPIANGAWGADRSPSAYANQYFQRAQVMAAKGPIPDAPDDRILLALGFTLSHSAVDTAIVGTRNPAHMLSNIEMVESQLPISMKAVEELHHRFDEVENDWRQLE
ncbi:aldo/keto reductase [Chloroflexota bacterium]